MDGVLGNDLLEGRDDLTPEKLFDARWASVLLDRALTRVKQEYAAASKIGLFDHLKGFLTGASDDVPYADAARTLGLSEGAVKVAVHRLRRRFRDALVKEIAETVSDPADIDGEIRHLLQAVTH